MSKPKKNKLDLMERYELSDEPGDQSMAAYLRSGLDWETFTVLMDRCQDIVKKRMAVMEQRLMPDDYLLSVDTRMEYLIALLRHYIDGPATQPTGA